MLLRILTTQVYSKKTAHVDYNDKNLEKFPVVKVNTLPTVREHLRPKLYDDNAISTGVDESSLFGLDPDESCQGVS